MKNQYSFSPQHYKEQFSAFIKVLAEKYKPLYIYSFGEFTDATSKIGCFINKSASEDYRYYLLMVTENATRSEHAVQDYVNNYFQHGTITILVHGREAITEAIRANNRFFITVTSSGELLYNYDPTIQSFQVSHFIPTKTAEKAKKQFLRRFSLASSFLESALGCLITNQYPLCLFMLHQVVEQCCIGIIRVHLGYRSDIHNLYRLFRLCDSFSPVISRLFPTDNEEGRRLFDLMVRSYSAARYEDNFQADQADAEKLYHQVAAFLKMTDTICTNKIGSLALDGAVYKQLVQPTA